MVRVHIKSAVHALDMLTEDKAVKVIGDEGTNPIRWLGDIQVYGIPEDVEVDVVEVVVTPNTFVIMLNQPDYDNLVEAADGH